MEIARTSHHEAILREKPRYLIGVAFSATGLYLFFSDAGLFGALFFAFGLYNFVETIILLNRDPGILTVRRILFGLRLWQHVYPILDIAEFVEGKRDIRKYYGPFITMYTKSGHSKVLSFHPPFFVQPRVLGLMNSFRRSGKSQSA